MSRDIIGRSLASTLKSIQCQRASPTNAVFHRSISTSFPRPAEDSPAGSEKESPTSKLTSLLYQNSQSQSQDVKAASKLENIASGMTKYQQALSVKSRSGPSEEEEKRLSDALLQPPHHLHIYATKHNTHITLTRPNRNPILSVAAGNINFRKAARGSYDAAYQLTAYVMGQIQEQGLMSKIQKLEVVLRGWGAGREAVTKALMGSEGRNLRGRIVRVTDATRLKFGGTRSPKPRRLG